MKVEQSLANRVRPAVLRNLVVGKRLIVERIAHHGGGQQLPEIALPHQRRRNSRQARLLLPAPLPFIAGEEEELVPEDGAAEHAAELVAAEAGFVACAFAARILLEAGAGEEVAGVEDRVAMEFEGRAVKIVRARFGRNDHLAA